MADQVAAFELSPDGKQIAYADNQGLKTMAVKGGKAKLLLKLSFLPEQWKKDARWPVYISTKIAWSPDGKKIAVAAVFLAEKKSKLTIVDVLSGDSSIVDHAGYYEALAWSPDSKLLAWIAYYAPIKLINGKYRLQQGRQELLIGSSSSSGHAIYDYPRMTNALAYRLSWLPSGDIAFSLNWTQIGLMKPDGSNLRAIPAANKPGNRTDNWMLRWIESPDGTQIAYSLARGFHDDNGSLWSYIVSDGQIVKVSDQYRPLDLAWSQDGFGIWFANMGPGPGAPGMRYNPRPPHQLHWISTDGKRHRKLREEKNGIRNIRCAKDGTVFYISGGLLHTAR